MSKVYHNESGWIVTYPERAIYRCGFQIPNTMLVVGRGPTTPDDPNSTTDQVFDATKLGTEMPLAAVPIKWREPLGLPGARKIKQVVKPSLTRSRQDAWEEKMLNFKNLQDEYFVKILAYGFLFGCVGLVIDIVRRLL